MQAFISRYYQPLSALLLVLIAVLAFYIGFWEGKGQSSQAVTLSCKDNVLSKLSIPLEKLARGATANAAAVTQSGAFVGSKNGTKYYPSLSCGAVKRIKSSNYIWFNSAEDAQLQGYSPGTC